MRLHWRRQGALLIHQENLYESQIVKPVQVSGGHTVAMLCCVPICNNVPICNKLLQIGTYM